MLKSAMMETWCLVPFFGIALVVLHDNLSRSAAMAQMDHGSALPRWPSSYKMKDSTFLMACNDTGA
jgi:hypothetical protein